MCISFVGNNEALLLCFALICFALGERGWGLIWLSWNMDRKIRSLYLRGTLTAVETRQRGLRYFRSCSKVSPPQICNAFRLQLT